MKNLRQVFAFVFLLAGLAACDQEEINPMQDQVIQLEDEGVEPTLEAWKEASKNARVFFNNEFISLDEYRKQIHSQPKEEALSNGKFNGDLVSKQEFRNLGGWTNDWASQFHQSTYKQTNQINDLFNNSATKSRLGLSHNADVVGHRKAYYRRDRNPGDKMKQPGGNGLYWRHYRKSTGSIADGPELNANGNMKVVLVLDRTFSAAISRDSWSLKLGTSDNVTTSTTSTRTKEAGISIKVPFSQILDDITLSGKYSIANTRSESYAATKTVDVTSTVTFEDNPNHLPKAGESYCKVRVYATIQGSTDKYRLYSRVKGEFNILPHRGSFWNEWHGIKKYNDFHGQVFMKDKYRTPYNSSGSVSYTNSPITADLVEFTSFGVPAITQAAKCYDSNGRYKRTAGVWLTPNTTFISLNRD